MESFTWPVIIKEMLIAIFGGFIGAIFGLVGVGQMTWMPAFFLIGMYTTFILVIIFLYKLFKR